MVPRLIRDDRPVDPIIIDILRDVAADASAEAIDYMPVGATARDILLNHVFGIAARRAAYDLDSAVAVIDWQQFHALRARLDRSGRPLQIQPKARIQAFYR